MEAGIQTNGARNGTDGSISGVLITTLATIASPCLDVVRNGGRRKRLAVERAWQGEREQKAIGRENAAVHHHGYIGAKTFIR